MDYIQVYEYGCREYQQSRFQSPEGPNPKRSSLPEAKYMIISGTKADMAFCRANVR
jgi:hypothetical protein